MPYLGPDGLLYHNFDHYMETKENSEKKRTSSSKLDGIKDIINKSGYNEYLSEWEKHRGKVQSSSRIGKLPFTNESGKTVSVDSHIIFTMGLFIYKGYDFDRDTYYYKSVSYAKQGKKIHGSFYELSSNSNERVFRHIALVRIKSCEESSKLFGYTQVKKKMLEESTDVISEVDGKKKIIPGKLYVIGDLLPNHTCHRTGEIRHVVEIVTSTRNYKFVLEDLEFVFPDLNVLTRGYNPPKDRKFKPGKLVRIVDDRHISIPRNTRAVIVANKNIGNKKFFGIKPEDDTNGKEIIVRAKNIRVI